MRVDGRPVVELASPLAQPPAALAQPCSDTVALPNGAMSVGAVERAWAQDRVSLVECGARHAAVVDFYARRDAGLASR